MDALVKKAPDCVRAFFTITMLSAAVFLLIEEKILFQLFGKK